MFLTGSEPFRGLYGLETAWRELAKIERVAAVLRSGCCLIT